MRPAATARIERSVLLVPANDFDRIRKAAVSRADCVLLDLDDTVPAGDKIRSRANVIRALTTRRWHAPYLTFRINGLDTHYAYRDLADIIEAAGQNLGAVCVPRVSGARDVYIVDYLVGAIERHARLSHRIGLELQIETAAGLARVHEIAAASRRTEALVFGPGDYGASLQLPLTQVLAPSSPGPNKNPPHPLQHALMAIVIAARAAGLRAVDGPSDLTDGGSFHARCELARSFGYDGKWCLTEPQVAGANTLFAPSREDVRIARQITSRSHRPQRSGRPHDGTSYDASLDATGRRTLEFARLLRHSRRTRRAGASTHV